MSKAELEEDLQEWELMRDELQRADDHDWEKENGRSRVEELHWVLGWIKRTKEMLKDDE